MSIQGKAEVITQEENYLHVDYDKSKLVLFGGEFSEGTFKNNTGSTADFAIGTVLARDTSDNTLVPYDDSVTGDGEDFIVGLLYKSISQLADAATVSDVSMVVGGEVREDKIVFVASGDDLDTPNPVSKLTPRDDMKRVGLRPKVVNELYEHDN
ncbi:MAG: hypothetical protein HRU26_05030 [Psychroserpens sp.]|nr:hypothetical protein [Psychroserpens sp.]